MAAHSESGAARTEQRDPSCRMYGTPTTRSSGLAKTAHVVKPLAATLFVTNCDRLCRRVSTILTFFQIAHDDEILAHRSQLVEGRSHWNMLGRSITFGLSVAIFRDGFDGASP